VKLYLDDIRDPAKNGCIGWHWAKTAEEAIACLYTGRVTEASLDHDLSIKATLGEWQSEVTGYDVCVWLETHPKFWPVNGVRVHSMNPAGRARMQAVIDRHYGSHGQPYHLG
jgi:hypothetical protein